jgi:hypothetical protein
VSGTFAFDKYINVNINDVDAKNHYLRLYNGDLTGQSYDAANNFFGNTTDNGVKLSDGYISLVINSVQYYLPKYSGNAKTDCCSSINGTDSSTGIYVMVGYVLVLVNRVEQRYIPIYTKS